MMSEEKLSYNKDIYDDVNRMDEDNSFLNKKDTFEKIKIFCFDKADYFIKYDSDIDEQDYTITMYRILDKIPFIYRIIINGTYISMQADPYKLHDRWSNCMFESIFKNIKSFKNNHYKILENYQD